jgi:hypothetical protein
MQTGQYQLTGTIRVGEKLYAFLKETKGGKGVRAAQGDVLSTGIKLEKVEPDKVLLTQYDSQEEVQLHVSKSTRSTPAATPMPGQAPQPPGVPVPQPAGQRPSRGFPGISDGAPGQSPGTPFVPGVPTMAPVVPGVVGAPPGSEGAGNLPPRRRGVIQ